MLQLDIKMTNILDKPSTRVFPSSLKHVSSWSIDNKRADTDHVACRGWCQVLPYASCHDRVRLHADGCQRPDVGGHSSSLNGVPPCPRWVRPRHAQETTGLRSEQWGGGAISTSRSLIFTFLFLFVLYPGLLTYQCTKSASSTFCLLTMTLPFGSRVPTFGGLFSFGLFVTELTV